MSENKDLILIDRLDNHPGESGPGSWDADIRADHELAADWAFLNLAVDSVRLGAIRDKVRAVRAASQTEAPVVKLTTRQTPVVRGLFSGNAMRIAVAAILILGASAVYKYVATTSTSLYNNTFTAYELGTNRGSEAEDKMEAAYRARNWKAVLEVFAAQPVKTNKSWFLAGMAQMELKNFPASVNAFETVLANNRRDNQNYFGPESEYYLGLSYLMNHEDAKGLEIINRIRRDVYHPYYPLASKISSTDLKIVEMKK